MKREVSHDEAFVSLDAVALDALDASERDAVLAHVDGCDECRAELAALRATAAQVAFAVAIDSGSETRQRVRARLMARATAGAPAPSVGTPADGVRFDAGAGPRVISGPIQPLQLEQRRGGTSDRRDIAGRARLFNALAWRRAEWMAIAASVLMVASVGLLAGVLKDRSNLQDALRAQLSRSQASIAATDSLQRVVASRDSLLAGLTGRDVAVMSLTSSGTNAPFARMFWDRAHNTWTLVAHNMPALKSGRTYQLWLVTAAGKVSAGTFDPHNGDAVVRATYPVSPASLRALAVTEEPAGGMPQPTGAMVIAATAQ